MSYINHERTPNADEVLQVYTHTKLFSIVYNLECTVMSCVPLQNTEEVMG